jgi:porphobilinogen synthase
MYPTTRLRRLRATEGIRRAVEETRLHPSQLVYPMFVKENLKRPEFIETLPGQMRLSVAAAAKMASRCAEAGIGGVVLFGIPQKKHDDGRTAWDPDGVVPQAVKAIKHAAPDLTVYTDVCLCAYTTHGHCGLLRKDKRGRLAIHNDSSLDALAKVAVAHADAGADMVAPSDMMDGRVARLRQEMDDAGHHDTGILAYSVKYASSFYGPFRDAAESSPREGPKDRTSHQMNPANVREALREAEHDLHEGADILMVKPAMPYLDVVRALRERFHAPLAAFQVSGEYSMIRFAAKAGALDERAAARESLVGITRAGADIIITYFALDFAR